MPWTMGAFTIAALGMMSAPPLAGFISEWYLGLGALAAGEPWAVAVLVASSLLNAAYFLPIIHRAWFREPAGPWQEHIQGRWETRASLLPVVTAALVLLFGLFAGSVLSPLEWVKLIAEQEYAP